MDIVQNNKSKKIFYTYSNFNYLIWFINYSSHKGVKANPYISQ